MSADGAAAARGEGKPEKLPCLHDHDSLSFVLSCTWYLPHHSKQISIIDNIYLLSMLPDLNSIVPAQNNVYPVTVSKRTDPFGL